MEGKCLCGEITFSADPKSLNVTACHCSICRKQSGGISLSIEVEPKSLIIQNIAMLTVFNSSEWAHRGFCKGCGTFIFWQKKDCSYCNVNCNLLEMNHNQLTLNTEVFIEEKPSYYSFANTTIKLTQEDLFTQHTV